MRQSTTRQPPRERFRRAKRLFLWLFPVEVVGEFPDQGGPMIVFSNHNSPLDGAYLWALLRRRSYFLADSTVFTSLRYAHIAAILIWTGQIPVNDRDPYSRKNPDSGAKALRVTETILRNGGVVGLQPEGNCGDEGQVVPFRQGITRLAFHPDIRDRVTLVCVGIQGSGRVMRYPHSRPRFFRRVRMVIGSPIKVPALPNTPDNRRRFRRHLEETAAELSNQRPPDLSMYERVVDQPETNWR